MENYLPIVLRDPDSFYLAALTSFLVLLHGFKWLPQLQPSHQYSRQQEEGKAEEKKSPSL